MKYRGHTETNNEVKLELALFAEFLLFSCLVFSVPSSTWMPPLSRQSESVQQNIVTLVSNSTSGFDY